jgi:hypothetical protein
MFLQQLWQHKLDWDTQLPTSLQEQWDQLLQTIPHLFHIKIPRTVICADAVNLQLQGFCDSSQGRMEHAYTFTPQTVTIKSFVNCCVLHLR